MSESIEQAFQALQTALVSLERAVSERAEMIHTDAGQADTGATEASASLSAAEKEAVQAGCHMMMIIACRAQCQSSADSSISS